MKVTRANDVVELTSFPWNMGTTVLPALFCVLFMYIDHLLYFVIAAHEDTRSIVDVFRYDCEHAFHSAVDCLSASCGEIHVSPWNNRPVKEQTYRSQTP